MLARPPLQPAATLMPSAGSARGMCGSVLREERFEPIATFTRGFTKSFCPESDKFPSKVRLFEYYHRGEFAIHVHLSILRYGKRTNLCLEMHRSRQIAKSDERYPVLLEDRSIVARVRVCCQRGYVDLPVLVLICESSESQQVGMHRVSPTLVRLQTLNDCNCLKRDSIKGIATNFLVKGPVASNDGEFMRRLCFFAWVVSPEEFTNKIIESGVGGLENISEDVRNYCGGTLDRLKMPPSHSLGIVISLGREPNVLVVDIIRDYIIENIEMMACPL